MISKKKKRILTAVVLLTGIVIGGGVCLFYQARYLMAVSFHMPTLAGAICFYYDEYGVLPRKIETIEALGGYPEVAYRLPKNVWEVGKKHTGRAPYYLPVDKWDGKTPYIIAIQGEPFKKHKERRYIIMLSTTTRFAANDEELAGLLEKDDQLREKMGQSGRWADVPWKE